METLDLDGHGALFPNGTLNETDKKELERFKDLSMFTMKGCGLRSLVNFPALVGLRKLRLQGNELSGRELEHLPRNS